MVTMKDYYDGTMEEHEDVAKDLDKGVSLGNKFYYDKVEDATGLILQYEKENNENNGRTGTTTGTILTITIMVMTRRMMMKLRMMTIMASCQKKRLVP